MMLRIQLLGLFKPPKILFYIYFIMKFNNNIIKCLCNYGDILAIPLFACLVYYFYHIENKSTFEYILFYFAIIGFVVDTVFTYIFLRDLN